MRFDTEILYNDWSSTSEAQLVIINQTRLDVRTVEKPSY